MDFSRVTGIEFDIDGADCVIKNGALFSINHDTGLLSYTRCGIWILKSMADKRKISITIPGDMMFDRFMVRIKDGTLTVDNICALNSEIYVSDAQCSISHFDGRFFYAQLGRGSLSANIEHSAAASFNCGFGNMDLTFSGKVGDYSIKAIRGGGCVEIDGELTKRDFIQITDGKPDISIKCGLGSVSAVFLD